MSRAFSDLAFTPAVRAMQTLMGSRANYAPLDHTDDRRDQLGPMESAFIEARDSFYQATVSETGWPYVQFRGGPAGFLKVLDPKTIGYADFRGNVQYISVGNLSNNDRVSIILMDYPNRRRLKLLGRVRVVDAADDPALIDKLESPHYRARIERAMVITIEGYDWNCPQHITPRFTEDEIRSASAPLRAEIAQLKTQLAGTDIAAPGHHDSAVTAIGKGALPLVVRAVRQLTPLVRAYTLAADNGAALPPAAPGAFIDVPVRIAPHNRSREMINSTRRYSIFSVSAQGDEYEIAVKRDDTGHGGSHAVHRDYQLGTLLNCGIPGNDFMLDDDDRPVVLVAGGIGITPLYAMAMARRAAGRDLTLHYAARTEADAALLAPLHAALGSGLNTYFSARGTRLDTDALVKNAPADAVFYICGPATLIEAVRTSARHAQIPAARVRVEQFSAAPAAANDQPLRVTLKRSGRVIDVGATETVLDAIQSAGIDAPASCRIGNCGTCAVKVLDGKPAHRDTALSASDRAAGLMCICTSRAHGASLTLDL